MTSRATSSSARYAIARILLGVGPGACNRRARPSRNLFDSFNRAATLSTHIGSRVNKARKRAGSDTDWSNCCPRRTRRRRSALAVLDKYDTAFPAKSLSDGTLRFLALSILAEDPGTVGVICFEEPENGIHPQRISAILELLKDIAVDTECPVDDDNPLRQVIVNTHSPGVVGEVDENDLLLARLVDTLREGDRFQRIQFECPTDTWRCELDGAITASKGDLSAYLRPICPSPDTNGQGSHSNGTNDAAGKQKYRARRVVDRPEMRNLFDNIREDD